MHLYEFKGGDEFKFDAHVFAATPQRAVDLFIVQLVINGENPDQMIWREVDPEWFAEPTRSKVYDALASETEGVASLDEWGNWWPVAPFDRRDYQEV